MKLSEKHLEVITRTAIDVYERQKELAEKQKHDRRLRNVKLLLRNYRSFKVHCGDLKLDIKHLKNVLELDELDTNAFAIESIIKSKERTLAMVRFIEQMIEIYQVICEKSGREDDKRIFQSIYQLYISDDKFSASDIAECHKTDTRTVYRDVDKASKALATLIFGVDSLNFR